MEFYLEMLYNDSTNEEVDNLKKFYSEHRVFIILMIIVLVCFIIMISLLLKYFYFGNSGKSPKRTCSDISAAKIDEITSSFNTDEIVSSSKMRISDKSNIIFISVIFQNQATLMEAESSAVSILDKFSDEEKTCYDFEFVITKPSGSDSDGFHLMGARNSNGTNVHWNNNREILIEDED